MVKGIFTKIALAAILIYLIQLNLRPYNPPTNIQAIPGTPKFPIMRLTEKIQTKLIIVKNQKVAYQNTLINKRLFELENLVESNALGEIENAGSRYMTQIQSSKNPKETLSNNTIERLEVLRNKYEYDSAYWLILQQCVDVTKAYLN